jgi:hypothetical protein
MCHSIKSNPAELLERHALWVGADRDVSHPDAPAGGAGNGRFRTADPLSGNLAADLLPHPLAPAARTSDPGELSANAAQLQSAVALANPAPRVTQDATQTVNGVTVVTKADQMNASGLSTPAHTEIALGRTGGVDAKTDSNTNKVTSFTNTSKFTVTIQTKYASGTSPDDASAYGRGTTQTDQQNKDTTIGFHESCHRKDVVAYLTNHPLPKFQGQVGMVASDFQKKIDEYFEAVDQYEAALNTDTFTKTDEVGDPTRTQYCQKHGCTP